MATIPSLAQVTTGTAGPAGGGLRRVAIPPADARGLLRRLDHPLAGGLRTAADLARARREGGATPTLPVSLPALARLFPAGLPRGELTELVGGRSSGRFSLVLALLAATTAQGEAAALVDLGDGLDPQVAATCGVALERLLWLRPHTIQEALAAAEVAVGCGFPLVAVDLGEPPLPGGRGQEFAWLRLARAAQAHAGALLLASPYRVSGPAATAVLRVRSGQAEWRGSGRAPRLLAGLLARLALAKGTGAWLGPAAPLALIWPGRIEFDTPEDAAAPTDRREPQAARAVDGDRSGSRSAHAARGPQEPAASDSRMRPALAPRPRQAGSGAPATGESLPETAEATPSGRRGRHPGQLQGPPRRSAGSPRPWHQRARAAMAGTALAAAAATNAVLPT